MTLKFAKNGMPLKDKTLQVYFRYQYKNISASHIYSYIPTGIFLSQKDFDLLLSDKLGGKVSATLHNLLDETDNRIKDYYKSNGVYPDKEWLTSRADSEKKTVEDFITEYTSEKQNEIKGSSVETNMAMLDTIKDSLSRLTILNKKNYLTDINVFAAEETTKALLKSMVDDERSNGYTRTVMLLFIRIQNLIRKKIGLSELNLSMKHLKSKYKKYMLKRDEIQYLLEYKTDNVKYLETQLLIKINMLIGLRIEEILNIEVTDIHFANPKQNEREQYLDILNEVTGANIVEQIEYLTIQITERKKSKVREIVIVNKEVIKIISDRIKELKTGRLFPNTNKDLVNYRLKTIARLTGKFDEMILIVKNVGTEVQEKRMFKWRMISTHSIRKFAVTENAKNDGLQVAKYYSGHSDLTTIQKHYLDDLSTEDVLEILKRKK